MRIRLDDGTHIEVDEQEAEFKTLTIPPQTEPKRFADLVIGQAVALAKHREIERAKRRAIFQSPRVESHAAEMRARNKREK